MAAEHSKHYRNVKYFLLNTINASRRILRGGNMNCKKSIAPFLLLTVFVLTIASTVVAQSTSEEGQMRNVYSIDRYGLIVKIDAPYQTCPGENISITVRAEAHLVTEGLRVEYMYLKIYGFVNETNEILLGNITHLEPNSTLNFLQVREYDYVVVTSNETSPGVTYGKIWCGWECIGMEEVKGKISGDVFPVTYIKNKKYEDLYKEHQLLSLNYTWLYGNYTELESQYSGELGGTRNMMYVLIVTTVVSVASVFFLIRRPKKSW